MANRQRKAIIRYLAKGTLRSRNSLLWFFAALIAIRRLCLVVALPFGLSLIGPTPLAAQGGCQPVDEAMNKVMTVPTHIYGAMSSVPSNGAKPRTDDASHSETIYVGGSVYTKVGGHWSRGGWTPQQIMKQEQENRQKSKYTCRYLRDESVNGEPAAVYSTHSERSDVGQVTSDGQVWISKSRGFLCETNSTSTPEVRRARTTTPGATNTQTSGHQCDVLAFQGGPPESDSFRRCLVESRI